jgi:hypothetical protein
MDLNVIGFDRGVANSGLLLNPTLLRPALPVPLFLKPGLKVLKRGLLLLLLTGWPSLSSCL